MFTVFIALNADAKTDFVFFFTIRFPFCVSSNPEISAWSSPGVHRDFVYRIRQRALTQAGAGSNNPTR